MNSKALKGIYRHTIGRLLVISRVIGPRLGDVIGVQQAPSDVILVFFADGQAQGGVSVRNGPERFLIRGTWMQDNLVNHYDQPPNTKHYFILFKGLRLISIIR